MPSMPSLNPSDWPALPAASPPAIDLFALRARVAKLEAELEVVEGEDEREEEWGLIEAKLDLKKYLFQRSHDLKQIPRHLRFTRCTTMELRAACLDMEEMEKELLSLGHKYTVSNVAEVSKTKLLPGESVHSRTWQDYLTNWPDGMFRQASGWGAQADETWERWCERERAAGEQQVAK
jgi:hypothetical protein